MKKLLKKIVAIGLSAAMTFGMAVTSFAAEETSATTTTTAATTADKNAPKSVTIDAGEALTLYVGNTYKLTATTDPKKQTVKWSVAENDNITVTEDGLVTATAATDAATDDAAAETVTVTATLGTLTDTIAVTVLDPELAASDVIFTDEAATKALADDPAVYVNGGKVKDVIVGYEQKDGEDGEKVDDLEKPITVDSINYKQTVLYSKTLVPETIKVKGKDKAGKLIAFVTLDENATPIVDAKGKVTKVKTTVDDEEKTVDVSKDDTKAAKNVASASVKSKNGLTTITVKAGKAEDTAYVWIIDVLADKRAGKMVQIPVNVFAAPKSVLLFDKVEETETETDGIVGIERETKDDVEVVKSIDKKAAVKKVTLAVGESENYYIASILDLKKAPFVTGEEGENYKATVDEKSKDLVEVTVNGDEITVKALALNADKPTKTAKAKVTIVNQFNNKKASLAVTIVNNVTNVNSGDTTVVLPDASEEKKTVEITYSDAQELTAGQWNISTSATDVAIDTEEDEGKKAAIKLPYQTTDKIKLYITGDATAAAAGTDDKIVTAGYKVERDAKGKDKFTLTTKSKDISAKLAKDGKITLTVKKGVAEAKGKLLIVCTHVDKTIDVYEVILKAAPSLKVDKEEVSIEGTGTATVAITATNGAESDVVAIKTAPASATATAQLSADKKSLTITGVAAGTTEVVLSYGDLTKTVKVTVTAAAAAQS